MRLAPLAALGLYLSLAAPLAAQTPAGTPPPAETPAPAESKRPGLADLGLKGHATVKNFSHFRETPTDNRNFREEAILQVEWERRLAPWARARVVVEAREDDDRYAQDVNVLVPDTATRRSVLDVKEAVLTLRSQPVEILLGKQVFAWGTADAFNPTDNLNPYDAMDPIDNEKLGVYSAAARASAGPASLTFVVVPVFTPTRGPLTGSRWVEPPTLVVDSREVPGPSVDHLQYATRLKATVAGWDVSGSYFDGFDPNPVLRAGVRGAQTVFTPVYTRLKVPGVDFSTTFGKLEVHAEGAFKLAEYRRRDDVFQGVGGVNYTWDELGVSWLEQVTFIVEHARETVLHSHPHSPFVEPLGLNGLRDAGVGRVQLKFNEETQLKFSGVLDLVGTASHYLQAKLNHKLSDALHLEAGLDFFAGNRDTFYGRWRDNDRFFFKAKYYF